MNQIKATSVQICIFTPHDLKSIGLYPPAEQYLYQMFGNAILELRQRHGANNTPVFLDFCPIDQAANASVLSQNGGSIMNLPAVQIYAKYPDGTGGQYFLKKGFSDIASDKPLVTEKTALQYTEALLYRLSPVTEPILCKLLPPLCSLGWYVWLGAAVYTTYKTTQARNIGKYAWGTAAALTWQAFVARGGLNELGKKVGIGRIIRDNEPLKGAKGVCNSLLHTTSIGPGTCSHNGGVRTTEGRKRALGTWRIPMKRALRQKGLSVPETDEALLRKYRNEIGEYPSFNDWRS